MNMLNSEISLLGVSLLIFGILGLIFGSTKKKQSINTVSANNGSVAAGGNIKGKVTIINANQNHASQKTGLTGWDIWNIVCGIATLIGLGLTVIPF